MKNNVANNIVMLVITAVILIAINAIVWLAAERGIIAAIDNVALWGAFVGINIISLLWAVCLLGLQPLVVTLSYGAGCGIAFMGVRTLDGVNMAEVMTAGATYGAFGVLAVGHATTKVRLAFFNKGQVPFALVMVGLLVIDGLLNSRISQAGMPVLLNAVAYPFVLAGVVPGALLMISRRKPEPVKEVETARSVEAVASAELEPAETVEAQEGIPLPEEPVEDPVEMPRVMPAAPSAEPQEAPMPVMAEEVPAEQAMAEAYIPFEIDEREADDQFNDGRSLLDAVSLAEEDDDDDLNSYTLPPFDADEFMKTSTDLSESSRGGVMVAEPVVKDVVENTEQAEPETKAEKEADWLSGHLELLNKLK